MWKYLNRPFLGEPPEYSSVILSIHHGLLNLIRAWSAELVRGTKIQVFRKRWTHYSYVLWQMDTAPQDISGKSNGNQKCKGCWKDGRYFENQLLRGKLKRLSRIQACGIRCKWKYWVKGIDFATVQFAPKTSTMCNRGADFSKSLSFLIDSYKKVIKIWKTSHKSVSQGTTACLSWAG